MIGIHCLIEGAILCAAALTPPPGVVGPTSPQRLEPVVPTGHLDLCGEWAFRVDPDDIGEAARWFERDCSGEWGPIHVPGSWQAQGYGLDYHGVGWYRREFEVPADWAGRQIWLRFSGAATRAKVWVDGQLVAEHVGNWVPFTARCTEALSGSGPHHLVVRVEEMPKHFSAGFWRVLGQAAGHDGHFGGLWQEVSLHATGDSCLADVFAQGHLATGQVNVEASLLAGRSRDRRVACVIRDPGGRELARAEESTDPTSSWEAAQTVRFQLAVPDVQAWSPESPQLYTARIEIIEAGGLSDAREIRFGMRDVARRGSQLLLNGKPLFVRGMLHWGYYPHLVSVTPSEEQIRREFSDLRAAGFNLVKVCLLVFPKRFYEIADETGMLVWQEYPTWASFPRKDNAGPHDGIVREFAEWHRFDRNHPSVILRSLSCEAHEPNLELMETLYKQAKSMTGGALIEDNSAFMGNVFSDWYDAHMYLDLDDYHRHLGRLAEQLRNKPEIKPYLSGEEMDCDTYRDVAAIRRELIADGPLPWWIDNKNFDLQEQVERELIERHGANVPAELVSRQNRHAIITRKGYIEDFRRYPEVAGFVICSFRDVTITRPGFYDDLMQPKWRADEWKPFIGERALILNASRRSHCYAEDELLEASLVLSNYGDDLQEAPLHWELRVGGNTVGRGGVRVTLARGQVATVAGCKLSLAELGKHVRLPQAAELVASLDSPAGPISNHWPIWVFPSRSSLPRPRESKLYVYSASDSAGMAAALGLSDAESILPRPDGKGWQTPTSQPVLLVPEADSVVLIADSLTDPVRRALAAGARVVYLPADNDASIPRQHAPFWREMAVWLPSGHLALGDFPHAGFVDLQFYDLTQRQPFDTNAFRAEIQPLVWGVNPRFMKRVVADYVFEAAIGKGKLLACCLSVRGDGNIAGRHLVGCLIHYAAGKAFRPAAASGRQLSTLLGVQADAAE